MTRGSGSEVANAVWDELPRIVEPAYRIDERPASRWGPWRMTTEGNDSGSTFSAALVVHLYR